MLYLTPSAVIKSGVCICRTRSLLVLQLLKLVEICQFLNHWGEGLWCFKYLNPFVIWRWTVFKLFMYRLVRFCKGRLTPVWQILNLTKDLLILGCFFLGLPTVPRICKPKPESPCSRCFWCTYLTSLEYSHTHKSFAGSHWRSSMEFSQARLTFVGWDNGPQMNT